MRSPEFSAGDTDKTESHDPVARRGAPIVSGNAADGSALGDASESSDVALSLREVGRSINGVRLLSGVDWEVRRGQRWVILGPNGSGKTTLVRIATMWDHPSTGTVELLGQRLGQVDVRQLRARVGFTSAAMSDMLVRSLTAAEAVMTAKHAALAAWWHDYDAADHATAKRALARVGCAHRADHRFSTLSSGERQRVLLARALSMEPGLIILDEPNAGLDLGGREQLINTLDDLAQDPLTPPLILVTHHTDEIPSSFTHALLLRDGAVLSSGRIEDTLTSANLSTCIRPRTNAGAPPRTLARPNLPRRRLAPAAPTCFGRLADRGCRARRRCLPSRGSPAAACRRPTVRTNSVGPC